MCNDRLRISCLALFNPRPYILHELENISEADSDTKIGMRFPTAILRMLIHFDLNLTCDIINDLQVKFLTLL